MIEIVIQFLLLGIGICLVSIGLIKWGETDILFQKLLKTYELNSKSQVNDKGEKVSN